MSIGPGGGFKGMCPNIHTPVFSGSIDFASLKRIWDELKIIPPGCGDLIRAMSITARLGHTHIIENPLQNGQKSDDHLPPISTALVLYDPTLPHVSLKAHLENVTDKAIKSSFEIAKFESRHLSLEEGRLSFLAQNLRGRAVVSAAQSGRDDMIKELLQSGPISEEHRGEAVVKAAQSGHVEVIDMLLQNGQINEEARGRAVLYAAQCRNPDPVLIQGSIERLLQDGAGIPIHILNKAVFLLAERVELRRYAVRLAAQNGHIDIIDTLLRDGSIREEDRGEAVWFAAEKGHMDIIERLLEGGAEISDIYRYQAVRCAAEKGHLEVIAWLIQLWPEIRYRGVALDGAASEGHIEVVERLLEGGAQIDEVYRCQAVVNAASEGHIEVVERLLRDGAEISEHHLDEALRLATQNGHLEVVERLLEGGAQIRQVFRDDAVGINDPNEYLYVPTWEDLENNPLGYLRSFVETGPSRIRFGDGTAVDTGGVTKEFVNRLVESLKEQKLICCDEDFGEWVSLPIAKTEEQKEALFLFGQLLTHLSRKNADRSDKIMIPKILNPLLFAVMLAGEGNELQTLVCVDSIRDIWEKDRPNSQSIQDLKSALFSQEEDGPFLTKFKEWKASVQEGIRLLKAGIDSPLTDAMGTPEGCGRLQEEFFGKEITTRSVMENLKIYRPQEFELSYGKMVRWLKEWIEKADVEKLIQFVFCTTGHKSLNMGKILIEQNNRGAVMSAAIEIHTCSNSLALPRVENIDQESFILALEASLEQKSYNVG